MDWMGIYEPGIYEPGVYEPGIRFDGNASFVLFNWRKIEFVSFDPPGVVFD
jgi:hypothetical protein